MQIDREQLGDLIESAALAVEEEMFINEEDIDLWKRSILEKFDELEGLQVICD
jgi:hypothetical protein